MRETLSPDMLARLKGALAAEISEIEVVETASAGDHDPIELDPQSVGRLSRMDSLQQQAMSRATRARRQQRKRQLEAALGRIEDGEYGFCTGCGEALPESRLAFDPAILLCLACTRAEG